jgi:hypothetical protein
MNGARHYFTTLGVLALVGTIALGCAAAPALSADTVPQGAEGVMTATECAAKLHALHATFAFTPPVAEGACTIPLPVRLQSLSIGADAIRFTAEPTLDCRLAERLADWIGNVVEPLARHHLGSGLAAIDTGPGYVCRNRNNEASGKLSEHARGNALDIAAFVLRDGRRLALRPPAGATPAEATFLAALRTTACGYFLTVLGPGSDAAHADHLHVDLGLHGRTANYRICE